MSEKSNRLAALARLAQMQREAELAKLAALTARDCEMRDHLGMLEAQKQETHAHLATDPQAGLCALGYLRLLSVEERRIVAARQLLQPEIAARKAAAARALGRHDVLRKLAKTR
ncbi:MAG: hypothetical protein H5U24_11735 [Thioclava marina]|jgi:hypothetical protein|uniref:hypothetical protein n=1 Tax=Thioclava marina TaxID=1915077 RepID=UPI001997F4BA|nr:MULTISPECIES: hypothetical protein [Thioclava]MBC7146062.1 hypothetical protein [Thioclava marina]MBD3802796.1 hypothetical protein [Thioclava sp.]